MQASSRPDSVNALLWPLLSKPEQKEKQEQWKKSEPKRRQAREKRGIDHIKEDDIEELKA